MIGALFGTMALAGLALADPPAMPAMPSKPMMESAGPSRIVITEVVAPRYRDAVVAVMKKPTISTRGTFPAFVGTPAVYDWLLDHPDRVSLAWQRLKVPCVDIVDAGNGSFTWSDGDGSELAWRTVGRFPDGLVWYATGKVKASPLTPSIPIKAVVVMLHPKNPADDGTATIGPVAHVYLQTDSKAANLILRLLGPTAPKLAEQGAEQLLFFFAGIAKHMQKHPEKSEELLAPAKK
jgi:hypothetical protein